MLKQIIRQSALLAALLILRASCQGPVNQQCLGCLCEAISGCNATAVCDGGVCGPFRVTKPYWLDAGMPSVNNEHVDSPTAYSNCASDIYCSALAVQAYMSRYQKDCTGDGKIDCDDFVYIHILGPNACNGQLTDVFKARYHQCKRIVGGSA